MATGGTLRWQTSSTERDTWADKLSDAVTYSPDWVPIKKMGWLVKFGANVKTLLTRSALGVDQGARVRRPSLQGRRKKMHRVGDHFSAVPLARWAVRLAKWEVPYDEGSQWAIKETAI
ncbi:hypothetical protein RI054_31g122310 [Pseudoscourfieldia marina]